MDEKMNFNFNDPEGKEVIIRHGEARELDKQEQLVITGASISAPGSFLESIWPIYKGRDNAKSKAVAVISRKGLSIELQSDFTDPLAPKITGNLIPFAELADLKINDEAGKYTVKGLQNKLRKLSYFFPDKEEYADTLVKLQKFSAKVNAELVRNDDNRGNVNLSFAKQTELENMVSFKLKMPLFEEQKPSTFNVEVIPDITDADVKLLLISDELYQLRYDVRDEAFDEALKPMVNLGITIVDLAR